MVQRSKSVSFGRRGRGGRRPMRRAFSRPRVVRPKMNVNVKVHSKGGNGTGRALFNNTVPRSSFKVSGSHDMMIVEGSEVITKLITNGDALRKPFMLNPTVAETFPKLTGFSQQFEKYRFKKVRLVYTPACAATLSGSIAMFIRTEYGDINAIPTSVPELAAFQYSAAGSVGGLLRTATWTPQDKRWYWTSEQSLQEAANSLPILFNVHQGMIGVLMQDSITADIGRVAGYLSLEYECEFVNMRPTRDKMVSTSRIEVQGMNTDGKEKVIDLGEKDSEAGNWVIDSFSNIFSGATAAAKVVGDVKAGVEYTSSFFSNLGAVAADSKRIPKSKDEVYDQWFNPEFCPVPSDEIYEEKKFIPMATGDYTLSLKMVVWNAVDYSVNNTATIYSSTGNNTGAFVFTRSVPFHIDESSSIWQAAGAEPNCAFYWSLTLASGDTRYMSTVLHSTVINDNPGAVVYHPALLHSRF